MKTLRTSLEEGPSVGPSSSLARKENTTMMSLEQIRAHAQVYVGQYEKKGK